MDGAGWEKKQMDATEQIRAELVIHENGKADVMIRICNIETNALPPSWVVNLVQVLMPMVASSPIGGKDRPPRDDAH